MIILCLLDCTQLQFAQKMVARGRRFAKLQRRWHSHTRTHSVARLGGKHTWIIYAINFINSPLQPLDFVRFYYYILLFDFTFVRCRLHHCRRHRRRRLSCCHDIRLRSNTRRMQTVFVRTNALVYVIFSETSRWTSDLTWHFDIGDWMLCCILFVVCLLRFMIRAWI